MVIYMVTKFVCAPRGGIYHVERTKGAKNRGSPNVHLPYLVPLKTTLTHYKTTGSTLIFEPKVAYISKQIGTRYN